MKTEQLQKLKASLDEVAEKLRMLGTVEYVPAGKQSHWVVRKHE